MNIRDIEARATARLEAERDARVGSISALAAAAERVNAARDELRAAEKQHTDSYAKATRLGWTDADLKDLGIEVPSKRPAGRPRGRKTNSSPAA